MPLTWDTTKCLDADGNPDEGEFVRSEGEWGLTEALIFQTMVVGIGTITEKNEDEFYARVHFIEQLYGQILIATRDGKRIDRPIMPLDIHRRIGLRTNAAFKDETRASFVRRHCTNGVIRDAIYQYGQAKRNMFEGRPYQFIEEPIVATASL